METRYVEVEGQRNPFLIEVSKDSTHLKKKKRKFEFVHNNFKKMDD